MQDMQVISHIHVDGAATRVGAIAACRAASGV
jgi:hypothetical protein